MRVGRIDVAKFSRSCKHRPYSSCASTSWKTAIDTKNAAINALVYQSQAAPSSNAALPLHNVAVAVKDNICTASMPTTCASAMLRDFTSPFDATVVKLLQDAGSAIVGKTNCDEFGMGSMNVHSVHGPVVNPHNLPPSFTFPGGYEKRSAGGSSGGSAAAVAAGMCDAALATDTGGSTRLPASYCGVVGHKPSYGLISRWGVVSFADSLDCVGILGRDVASVKRVYDVLAVYDHKDPTAASPNSRQEVSEAVRKHAWTGTNNHSLDGLRIGVPQEYFPAEMTSVILAPTRRLLAALQSRGAALVPVSLPSTSYALSAYYVISSAEASSNMARYDGVQYGMQVAAPPGADRTKTATVYARTRAAGFGREVQKRILLGTYALTADAFDNYFLQAQRVRARVRADFDRVFAAPNVLARTEGAGAGGVHVLLHPSAIRTAPPLAEAGAGDGLAAYVQDVLTVPASLAGLPALSVPMRAGAGWPVGISVVGQWGYDHMVMRVGEIIQEIESA